jgi:4-hydroxybenzoate polyprenyltransferase
MANERPGIHAVLWRLARPYQWVKNGFVLVGLLFAHQWDEPAVLADAGLVLAAFCLMSSAVYALNDIADREADRAHPDKRRRPLASGAIGVRAAGTFALGLAVVALGLAAAVSPQALAILLAYLFLNVAYSAGLKHVAILDVFIIAAGFMLRLLAGTLGIGIEPSRWLLLCGLMVTLFLGFCKRRAELVSVEEGERRPALADYDGPLLDRMVGASGMLAVVCYGLYTVDASTVELHGTAGLVWTLPFVLFGVFRYWFMVYHRGGGADPASELPRDPFLAGAVAAWLVVVLAILY